MPKKVNVEQALASFHELWAPRIVAELNGQHVRVAKVHGEFCWHHHANEDELFYVVKGRLRIEFRDHEVELAPGELLVVPRGVEHRPVADEPTEILLFEPAGVVNTGEVENELTKKDLESL